MRNLILMLTILFTGIVSAQTYGPNNGVTFTVTGTSLGIAGSSSDGQFTVNDADLINPLRAYANGGLTGAVVVDNSDYTETLVISEEQYMMLDETLDGTIVFYDADGNVVENLGGEVIGFYPDTNTIEFADGGSLLSGYTWMIVQERDCINGLSRLSVIHAAIIAVEPNYESQGNGTWIDRDTRPNGFLEATWNQIEIDGAGFVLEIGVSGDGAAGTRTSYDCLEDLLASL